MPGSDPWKNRKSVRICAIIDMAFALLVTTVYVGRLLADNSQNDGTVRGFFRPGEKPAVTATLWFAGFLINGIQLIIAYLLAVVVNRDPHELNGVNHLRRCKYWLAIANIVFVMLISKFIFFVFFDKGNDSAVKILMLILCIAELFFKAYAMYFVKEFLDDLKATFNSPSAKVQFVATAGPKRTSV